MEVVAETIWRWATAYRKYGLESLYPQSRPPKPSKFTSAQKATMLAWLYAGKTAEGENIHWTLERLRQAILEAFGITLGIKYNLGMVAP